MLDHSLESSHRDDSNKWSNIGSGEEITQVELIEVNLTNLIWSSESKWFLWRGGHFLQLTSNAESSNFIF